ncbi:MULTISPECIES: LiaG family protein [Bacillus]|uniref:DUF4097 domain-containing protein n=2 Tax=Bacillus TaxID=1386 RepID=A0A0M5JJ33_9BACI|nr:MULTISPECIES: DUF4097 domain-containing protein [Bacillus]ALC82319.1 hypothetical protein AM592_12555 [Bacillus gobiensis]MBP1081183.1 lia operon protein LiaG [Bacillus capparidis]MED1095865.1 DUF4097 domain-containing protein [Bacillus capparidis]
MKKLVGNLMILFGILLLVFLVFRDGFFFLISPGESNTTASADVSDIDEIEVSSRSTNVDIVGEERDDIYAELHGGKNISLDASESGGKLSLNVKHKGLSFFSFFQDHKLVVHVPAEYKENLSADLTSGNLRLSADHQLSLDQLSLETSSGNIKVDEVDAKELNVKGTSGNIGLSDINASNSTLRTTSGNIEIENLTGKIHSKLTSGNVTVSLNELTNDLQFQLTSGELSLSLPEDADIALEANTTSGDISHSFDFDKIESDENKLKASKGKANHNVSISVTSGDVEIDGQ